MSRKRTGIWRYFTQCEDDLKYVKCDLCENVRVSRGSADPRKANNSNMTRHFKLHHGEQKFISAFFMFNFVEQNSQKTK